MDGERRRTCAASFPRPQGSPQASQALPAPLATIVPIRLWQGGPDLSVWNVPANGSGGPTATGMKSATSTVFLSGDVITGRGIDQNLPHRSAGQIFEGIVGFEAYRGEHGLIHLAKLDAGSGELVGLTMVQTRREELPLQLAQDGALVLNR
jgi:hypothetical protein